MPKARIKSAVHAERADILAHGDIKRRAKCRRLAGWNCILATVAACFLYGAAWAAPEPAIAMHGQPKHADALPHLSYVNPGAPKGGELRLGALGSFDSLNPLNIRGEPAAGVIEYVYEPLMARSYDEPFSLYGLIAESIETPEDRSSVTFQIRPEAHFSDGVPVTPADVLFSWSLLKEKGGKNHREYYKKVTSAEKVGDRGVKFTFAGSGDREMPLIMGLMPILPQHAVAPGDFDKTSFAKPVGTGAYTVADVSPGSSIVFKRNPDYWGRNLPVRRGQFNFDTIRIDYYRDSTTMMDAFRKGLFDVMGDSDSIDPVKWTEAFDFPAARAGLVKKLEFSVGVPAPMAALVFNTRRPIFADPLVRQALTRAFDFEWLNKTFFRGLYARTESFFDRSELSSHGRPADGRERELLAPYANQLAPGVLEGTFSQPVSDGTGTNRGGRREAIALLNEAGYQLKDGVMTSKATGLSFTFEMLCGSAEQERLMLAYSASLRQIGIDTQIRRVDSAQFEQRLKSFDFDMIEFAWASSLSPGNEQSNRWASAQADEESSRNFAGVKSQGVDAMIAAMLKANTREEFVSAVRAFDRLLLSGRYGIPLYYAPKQWIAAWSHLRQPPGSTLYGARLETWWHGDAASALASHPD